MTTVRINNIEVKFPFAPYNIQKDYMSKVIECLQTQQNGILESPTGTGKTLSLLCASLAWLENRKTELKSQPDAEVLKEFSRDFDCCEDRESPEPLIVPKIIYASRTHTQLQQAMQEMKRTAYCHMKACVLGSREMMCINQEVIEEKSVALKVNMCRTKVKKKQCLYYRRVEKQRDNPSLADLNIVDMEDIVTLGRTHDFCPYYMARELKLEADIIFMPYNYLLDPRMSKAMGLEIHQNIIIFDEAHNIEKVCEDSVSVQIKTIDLDAAIEDLSAIVDILTSGRKLDVEEPQFTPQKLLQLQRMLMSVRTQIDEIRLVQLAAAGTVFDGDYIFNLLEKAGISDENNTGVSDLIDNVLEFLASTRLIQKRTYGLQIFADLLFVAFYKKGPQFRQKIKECFKVQIDEELPDGFYNSRLSESSKTATRVLNFWCFSPGFGMNMLMDRNIHCVILTSGTLAPLKPLISELELTVGVQIENPHIVTGDQVCVKILSKGPDMQLLNSNYQNRNNPKYIQSLGLVISNLIRIIPDGVLIFFPSYFIMEKSIEHWKDHGIWDGINQTKPIYVEPKNKNSFNAAMIEYYSKIQDPSYKGAIFMGVCRGKVSEGLDFADNNGRAVLITGLPYPPLKDPKVILKKDYLNFRNLQDKEYLKGDEWYNLEATRAVNQAIGRVIRHKNDYGAIILLDSRFTNWKIKNNMSRWLRQHITDMKNFGETIRNVRLFFQNAQIKIPKTPTKNLMVMSLVEPSTSEQNRVKIHSRAVEYLGSPPKKWK